MTAQGHGISPHPVVDDLRAMPPAPPFSPGGGLRVFGCLWRIASDDLVLPSWVEFVLRCVGLGVVVGVLVFERITEDSCASEFHLDLYLAVAVALFTLTLVDLLLLALESAKGAIWDPDPSVRQRVVPLVYANIALTAVEFVWALVGSVWVVRGLMAECVKRGESRTDAPLYAISAVILVTWIFLFVKVFISLLSFNTMDCARDKKVSDNNETLIADSRPSLKHRLFSLCMEKTQIGMFRDVANVLSAIFDDDSFVPTDLAAALILLYARQAEMGEVRVNLADALSECPPEEAPREDGRQDVDENSNESEVRAMEQWGGEGGGGDLGIMHDIEGRDGGERAWDDPEVVTHFMGYAGAAYGYTWFLIRNAAPNLCKMYGHLSCCACCCTCVQEEGLLIEGDNCLSCNTAALRAVLPHLDGDSLVHISFRNKMAEVPYFVAVDHGLKKIVVSIRGTLSLEDTLTDLCATPESMGSFHDRLAGHVVHSGMFKAAKYVYTELRDKNILNKAFSYYDDYQLAVTGHSLGAGTAVILTFMLKQMYHSARCYAFSPPGGLLNGLAARESQNFTLSVIVGKDLVCRLSLHALARLKENMKEALLRCKLPKYQILSSGLSACCIKDWRTSLTDGGIFTPPTSRSRALSESEASIDSREPILRVSAPSSPVIQAETVRRGEGDSSTPLLQPPLLPQRRSTLSDCEKLFLPGRIWHVEGSLAKKEGNVSLTVRTSQYFQDILVSPKMLTDHFPNNVYDALQMLAKSKKKRAS